MADHTEHVRYGQLDHEYVARLRSLSPDQDGPILMLNLMRYREWADYPDGRTGVTGEQADNIYAPLEILQDIGAGIVLFGVVEEAIGDGAWERVAIVRYPTVRSFIDMQDRPDFVERHVHKDAGMLETIIAVCHPTGGTLGPARRLRVELLGPGAAPEPGPGRLVMTVDGSPVGDGRRWVTAVVSDADLEAAPVDAVATGGVVSALIQELP